MTTITEHPDVIGIRGTAVDVGPRITLNNDYPPVALELLLNIVRWAEQDHLAESDPAFAGWGKWEQGSWAALNLDGAIEGDLKVIADRYNAAGEDDDIEQEAVTFVQSAARANLCGSAFCMAGQTVYQAGFRMILDDSPVSAVGDEVYADNCIAEYDTGLRTEKGMAIWRDRPEAQPVPIDHAAREILGLTSEETVLFEGDNDITKIKSIVNWICQHRSLPLPYPDEAIFPDEYDPDEY